MPATPDFSKTLTVFLTSAGPPKPVSMSAITGMLTALAILPACLATSLMERRPVSGRPALLERPAPDI